MSILTLDNLSVRAMLRHLLSGATLSPKQLAMNLDIAPQTARNMIGFLYKTGHAERVGYGKYRISDMGRRELKRLESQLPPDQKKGEE